MLSTVMARSCDAASRDRGAGLAYVGRMIEYQIIDAALFPAMSVALLAGALSFLSPCVLPIVPPYLAYMSGVSVADIEAGGEGRRKGILAALFFVLGLSTIFILLGFTASAFGSLFLQYQTQLAQASGVVVIIFGLHFLASSAFRSLIRKHDWSPDNRADQPLVPTCWVWPLPLAGHPASGRSWGRSCPWRPPRRR